MEIKAERGICSCEGQERESQSTQRDSSSGLAARVRLEGEGSSVSILQTRGIFFKRAFIRSQTMLPLSKSMLSRQGEDQRLSGSW